MFIITFLIKSKNIIAAKYVEKRVSIFDNLDDNDNSVYNQETDKENNELETFYSNLISAIEVRCPLYDHTLPLSTRSEAIKTKLWNEIYVELQGGIKHFYFNLPILKLNKYT